jgi:hypothetical protein
MYKGWQISLTTVPPQEVAVFENVEDIRPFKTFRTVAEAIDWVKNNAQSKRRYSAWHYTEPGLETQQEVEKWIAELDHPDEWRVVATEDAFGDRRDVEEAMLDEHEQKVQQRIREAIDAERQRIIRNLIGDKQ